MTGSMAARRLNAEVANIAKGTVARHMERAALNKTIEDTNGAEARYDQSVQKVHEAREKADILNNQGENIAHGEMQDTASQSAQTKIAYDSGRDRISVGTFEGTKKAIDVDGYTVSLTSGGDGSVRTQYISSMDGINVGAKFNADYGALAGAKATNEMDVRSQAFLATVKSVGQDALDYTPVGRAMKIAKRSGPGKVAKKLGGSGSTPSGSTGGGYVQPRINYSRM